MADSESPNSSPHRSSGSTSESTQWIDGALQDPAKKALILQWLGLDETVNSGSQVTAAETVEVTPAKTTASCGMSGGLMLAKNHHTPAMSGCGMSMCGGTDPPRGSGMVSGTSFPPNMGTFMPFYPTPTMVGCGPVPAGGTGHPLQMFPYGFPWGYQPPFTLGCGGIMPSGSLRQHWDSEHHDEG